MAFWSKYNNSSILIFKGFKAVMYGRSFFHLFSLPVVYEMKSFLLLEFISDDKWTKIH